MTRKDKPKDIPQSPGVYFWLDENNVPLYIGRASNLKNRLSQYWQNNLDSRIAEMVARAHYLRYQTTGNLLEAIILEANEIKKYWPKYNVRDKDNRSFLYLVINPEEYPKPIIVRQRELKTKTRPKSLVFGPYQSQTLLQNALRIIRRLFPYSTCVSHSGRPCFDYQIGLCPGACVDAISQKEYQKNIKNIILLLSGEKEKLLKKLAKENPDKAKALNHIQDVSLLTREEELGGRKFERLEAYDISHLAGQETYGSLVVFSDGKADKKEYRLFKIQGDYPGDDFRALQEVLARRFKHQEWSRPDLIMIDGGIPQVRAARQELLRQNINIPLVGISKYGNDSLVYPPQTDLNLKKMIAAWRDILLQAREEAHRFVITAGRKARRKKMG